MVLNTLVVPLPSEKNDLQIFRISYCQWDCFPSRVLAELQISVWHFFLKAAIRAMDSNWILTYHIPNLV